MATLQEAFIAPATRTWLLLVLGFSIFLLLIACANVATLQIMRSVVRQREYALREALGASRSALFRQAMAENAWLAGAGAILGVLFAFGSVRILKAIPLPDMLVRESGVFFDVPAALFAAGVAIAATFLFGLAPGLLAPKIDLESALRESARGISNSRSTRRRLDLLTGAEVMFAFLSLFGAGLFAVSCQNLENIPLGFEPRNLLTMQIPLGGEKYSNRGQIRRFYRSAADRISMVTGVQEFALSSSIPLTGGLEMNFGRADELRPPHGQEPFAFARITSPTYFHLLRIPIVKGRVFSDRDTASSPRVAMINQNLARSFFANEDPIGKQLSLFNGEAPGVPDGKVEIVGVAANVRDVGLDEIPFNDLYLPVSQNATSQMYVVARTNAPTQAGAAMHEEIQSLDPEQYVEEPRPIDFYVQQNMRSPRFNLALVSGFGALGLMLTAVALFGTLSFAITQQTREIGLRIALGARRANIVSGALNQVLRLTAAGAVPGLGIAWVLGSLLGTKLYMVPHQHDGILYGVSIHDPLSFAGAAAVLFFFAGLAGLLPALRAARIDPNTALRCE